MGPGDEARGAGDATDVVSRLRALERELVRLRAEVVSRPGASDLLPSGEFQILRFGADGTVFGVPLADVVEVVRVARLLRVGAHAGAVLGLLNLRGVAIPIIDLGARLRGTPTTWSLATPIIIASASGRPLGLLVDSVDLVVDVPAATTRGRTESAHADLCVSAVVEIDGALVQVVDVRALLDCESSASIERLAAEGASQATPAEEANDEPLG